MADIRVTPQRTAVNVDIPVVRPATAGIELMQNASRYAFDLGTAIAEQGEKNYMLRLETSIRKNVSQFQREFGSDPALLQENLDKYRDEMLENLEMPRVRTKVESQFEVYAAAAMNKAFENRQKVVDTESELAALVGLDTARNSLMETSGQLYNPDPDAAVTAAREAQMQLGSIASILKMTKSDGTPMFTAEQQFTRLQSARDGMLENAATVWLANQPDKIQGLRQWRNGEVNLNMPDEKGQYDLNSIPPEKVFDSLIMQESGGQQFAKDGQTPLQSSAGAIGIAQVMPGTGPEAARMAGLPWDEARYKTDAEYNKALGRAYFAQQLKDFGGNNTLALMAYNAGPGAVRDFMEGTNKTGKNPRNVRLGDPNKREIGNQAFVDRFPFEETRNYVRSITTKVGVTSINVRNALPRETQLKVDKALVDRLKDQISLENAVDAKADRDLRRLSEQTFTDLMLQYQEGKLTVEMVDMAKPNLEPDKYIDARRMALQDNPETRGDVKTRLLLAVANGEDITAEARAERFENRTLSNEDYLGLLDRVNRENSGLRDPVKVNEDYVMTTLGKYATEIGLPQSAALGHAQREYAERVAGFQQENKRGPTFSEARELADDVVRRYSLFNEGEMATQIPTPRFMDSGAKASGKTKPEYMDEVARKTTAFYLQQVGGNAEALKEHPEYRREMDAVMKLKNLYLKREESRANAAAK